MYELGSVYGDNPTPSKVVILIHGTWGSNSPWTLKDSEFCKRLIESLSHYGENAGSVVIKRFQWCGWNSIKRRQKASAQLTARLVESLKKFPEAEHILVAHSHGGNIGLGSMTNVDLGSTKLICLSTPILYAIPRARTYCDALKYMASVFLLWTGFMRMFDSDNPPGKLPQLAICVVAWLAYKLMSWYQKRSAGTVAPISKPVQLDGRAILFLTCMGDEPLLGFAAVQLLQNCMAFFNKCLTIVTEGALRIMRPIVFIAITFAIFVLGFLLGPGSWLGAVALILLLALNLVPPVAMIVAVIVYGNSALLVFFGVLPFGMRLALALPWYELSVQSVPPGQWRSSLLIPSEKTRGWLRHTFSYQQQDGIDEIAKFILDLPPTAATAERARPATA